MEDEDKKQELIKRLQGMGIEIGGGIATDVLTGALLNPLTLKATAGLSGLAYGAINFGQGAYTNYLVQKHLYGEDELNWGEILASGAAGAIPFMNIGASKGVAKVVGKAGSVQRGLVGGTALGIGSEQLRVGIDDNRLLTPQELAFAGGAGGVFGAGFTQLGKLSRKPKVNPAKTYPDALAVDPTLDSLISQRTVLGRRLLNRIDATDLPDPDETAAMTRYYNQAEQQPQTKVDKFNYGEDVLANVPDKTKKLLKDNGFTDNESILLVSNFNKPIPRDLSAAIESLYSTVEDFDDFKKTMLPVYLESMKKLRRDKTPQADHVAQLRAALPFFYNKPVKLWPQISDIIVGEGVFGLGHNNKNLKYLEFDVHSVKTAFWKAQVGDAGEKFFAGRPLDTPDQIRAAAKEFAAFIKRSNKIVNDAVEQYNFMNMVEINEEELIEFINRLGAGRIDRTVSIKQVKDIFDEMLDDGFIESARVSQRKEAKQIKAEDKEATTKAKFEKQFEKEEAEVSKTLKPDVYKDWVTKNEDKFPKAYPYGMADPDLYDRASKIVDGELLARLNFGEAIQGSLFAKQNREQQIKNLMRAILGLKRKKKK